MNTVTDNRHVRRHEKLNTNFTPSRDHLIAPGARYVPKVIATANKVAWSAYEAMTTAEENAARLRDEAKGADAFDQHLAELALAAGEPTPPSTVEAKKAKADEAERNARAARNVACLRVWELFNNVAENFPEWIASRERAHSESLDRVRAALAELADGFPMVAVELDQLTEARRWENNPLSHALSAQRTAGGPERQLAKAREAVASRAEQRLGAPRARDVAKLITDLEHAVEDGR